MPVRSHAVALALTAVVLSAVAPTQASAQAPTSLASLRVGYNTRKATVRPEGDLKAQIDAVDQALAEATRLGRTGEMRRLLAKGTALLAGRAWTDELDYSTSLVVRSDRVVIDPARPYSIRIEQIYSPTIRLERALTAQVTLRARPTPATGGGQPEPGVVVKELGTFDGVGRDLRDAPFAMDLDLAGVHDGVYQMAVAVSDQSRPIGRTALLVSVRGGLDATVANLEKAAARAPEPLRADILFPLDRMTNVNRGRLELRTFDPEREFPAAEALAAAIASGRDPYKGRTGDFERHYVLRSASEIIPYRMYVPTKYDGTRAYPLIVALHGLGGTEDSFFENYDRQLPPLAEQHGYIVAAPLGYRVDGSYGWGLGNPPADPATRATQERSEEDVMEVLRLVREQYKIDDQRIYLMGHSMGAIGTWKIAPKFPDMWTAIAPISGAGVPATLERIRHVPEIVVHGDADPTVNVQGSRAMVAQMKALGIEHQYIEVPGGNHSGVVAPNLAAVIAFFDAHPKKQPAASRPTGDAGSRH